MTIEWTFRGGKDGVTNAVEFGAKDARGRAIGGKAYVWPHRAQVSAFTSVEVEGEWEVRTRAMRDGREFGAIGKPTVVKGSLEEAKALAEKKLAAAAKRAAA